MRTDGSVLKTLLDETQAAGRPYGDDSLAVVKSTVEKLIGQPTSSDRPGMLLGMIQSGKTRTFLGVIALAADNEFESFIVLTKGTKALTTQTYERLKKAYETVIDLDELRVFDIMTLPKLTKREQKIPLIIVAKKEKRNLERLKKALLETYPALATRRTLIIDDEADFASVGFKRSASEQAELQAIMRLIDDVRHGLPHSSFLQVTATPYSLYLQPTDPPATANGEFRPVRPAFTELVPIHNEYVGGQFYFEQSQEPESVASFLYKPVQMPELEVLHHPDLRRFKPAEALTSNGIPVLRQAIVTFIIGGIIRRLQAKQAGEKPRKYSFIIHTESSRASHTWQESIVDAVVDQIAKAVEQDDNRLNELVRIAYDDLALSIKAGGDGLPSLAEVSREVPEYVPSIQVEKVNSEKDVMQLLDRDGQLELRNRLNIFIGGQILDRGLTIANLIGFYYGRRAQKFQQDTVLQHARMYGARPNADLAVTRFYTSPAIYQILRTIHEFDAGLRNAFLNGGEDAGVVFIRKEGAKIVPCSPNKILLSTLTTLHAGKRLLPVGFQTGYKTYIAKIVQETDAFIDSLVRSDEPVAVDASDAKKIVDLIASTYEAPKDSAYEWDVEAFRASIDYVSRVNPKSDLCGKVFLLVRRNRDNVRIRDSGRFFDAPDTSHVEGAIARKVAHVAPMLMLFRQNGAEARGWRGTPFWWPVLYMPQQMGTVVFASDVNDYSEEEELAAIG